MTEKNSWEKVPIDTVHQDPRNARQHSPRNLEVIARSLERFGQQRPIVVGRASRGLLRRRLGWILHRPRQQHDALLGKSSAPEKLMMLSNAKRIVVAKWKKLLQVALYVMRLAKRPSWRVFAFQ